jgi:hypothetical protein
LLFIYLFYFFVFVLHGLQNIFFWSSPCQALYKTEGVEFLLDPEDSMLAYEERGRRRNRTPSDTELEQNALAGMNHVQKIEMIQGKYTVIMLLVFLLFLYQGSQK